MLGVVGKGSPSSPGKKKKKKKIYIHISMQEIMEEYGIMEYLELAVTRCGRWTGNREFIWSGLSFNSIDIYNPDQFCSGRTIFAVIAGPAGPFMSNICGPADRLCTRTTYFVTVP